MKKLCLIIILFSVIVRSFAQPTLVHSFAGGYLYPGCFSTGAKYVVLDKLGSPSTIEIYNLDQTLFKTIAVPSQGGSNYALVCLADNLFDNDSTTFEYLLNVTSHGPKLYREDSTLLWSVGPVSVFGTTGSPSDHEYTYIVFENDSGAFMQVVHSSNDTVDLYKLPGKISYCNSCCGTGGFTPVISPQNGMGNRIQLGNPNPNPADQSTVIHYQLPSGSRQGYLVFYDLQGKEVKRLAVGNAFDYINVSSSELPPGSYYYNLQTSEGYSTGKKLVVIR